MTIIYKIKTILKEGALTQAELARKIGVSSVTLNSWVNGRSTPYNKHKELITAFYQESIGERIISNEDLSKKNKQIIQGSKKYKNILKLIIDRPDLVDEFGLLLTYNSNKLEGSTLTIGDTQDILFNNSVIKSRSIIEHLEARNHHTAWKFLLKYVYSGGNINAEFGLQLHRILMNGILDNAGTYRKHNVRIVGSYVPTANYLSIDKLLKSFYKSISKGISITQLSRLHGDFEKIHPFTDGNGRIGRLLLNAGLLKINLPPAIINQEKKKYYLKYLQKYQLQEDSSQLEYFIMEAILEGLSILDS